MEARSQDGGVGIREIIVLVLIGAGLWECFLGWAQLLGFMPSRHALYPATGSFFNPGPFCGFLAMLVPLAFYRAVVIKKGLAHWVSLLYLVTAVGIMPALMGRTGWIAATVGCGVVAFGSGWLRRPRVSVIVAALAVVSGALVFMLYLKPASALGRLFLWRVGLSALASHPLSGVGWSGVPGALGNAQEAYFHTCPDSVFAQVAGSPGYAFNEFIQVGIAFGIPVMLLFIGLVAVSAWNALRASNYGVAGSIVAFAVVCFSSYPLQFPEFIAAAGLLVLLSVASYCPLGRCFRLAVCVLVCAGTAAACIALDNRAGRSDSWAHQRYAYQRPLDSDDALALDSLAAVYGDCPEFLFDYGKALRQSGLYCKSTAVLMRGVEVSSDPMFLNLIGRNCHDTGSYEEAEYYFRRSIDRLPKRMYPYYLLALLYADPAVSDTARFEQMHEAAIALEPKVMSPAIRQMRHELDSAHKRLFRQL